MTEAQAKHKIEALSKEIEQHNYNYYALDKPAISDYEFDMLLEELIKLEREFPALLSSDSPSQRVGGAITKVFKQIKHKYAMLSLGNSYSKDELSEFDERVRKGLGIVSTDLFNSEGGSVEYVCELKFDGL